MSGRLRNVVLVSSREGTWKAARQVEWTGRLQDSRMETTWTCFRARGKKSDFLWCSHLHCGVGRVGTCGLYLVAQCMTFREMKWLTQSHSTDEGRLWSRGCSCLPGDRDLWSPGYERSMITGVWDYAQTLSPTPLHTSSCPKVAVRRQLVP